MQFDKIHFSMLMYYIDAVIKIMSCYLEKVIDNFWCEISDCCYLLKNTNNCKTHHSVAILYTIWCKLFHFDRCKL